MKALLQVVLACPACRGKLEIGDDWILCTACDVHYPVVQGVPIMTPGGHYERVRDPPLRDGYDPGPHRRTMGALIAALPQQAAILDLGSGNMRLDLPAVIRMDTALTNFVDIVADAHHLPFRDGSLDMVLSLSVLEHLRQPFEAAEEMYRVLKPGGYVYHETNFVFPYHGYPHHYFNFSPQGLHQVFGRFRLLQEGVATHQMPSVTIECVINTYVYLFLSLRRRPRPLWRRIGDLAALTLLYATGRRRNWLPYDEWFEDLAYVLAAGVYCYGLKQPAGGETVIPAQVMEAHRNSAELTRLFPEPEDLSGPENVITRVLGVDTDALFVAGARYVDLDTMKHAQRAKGARAVWAYLRGSPFDRG